MLRRGGFVLLLAILVASATPVRAGGGRATSRAVVLRGDALRTGAIVSRSGNANAGAHASEVLSLQRGRIHKRAVFKPALGEKPTFLGRLAGITPGTHVVREVATSDLARSLQVTFVPPTVMREIEGRYGSVQMFIEDAVRATDAFRPGRSLVRREAEKMRVFDYIIGNSDRTVRNLMVRKRDRDWVPVAIDNGNAFPRGPIPYFQWPSSWVMGHKGPLLGQTRRWIDSIDAEAVARTLAASGIEQDAAVHVLRRLERLKKDPSFLAVPSGGRRLVNMRMSVRATLAGRSASQGLKRPALARIDEIVRAAYALD